MAVIKSGATSDQMTVDAVSKAARVTLYDTLGVATEAPTVNHDAADSGAPTKIGGRARTSNITSVDNNDRVDAIFDKQGKQLIVLSAIRELVGTGTNASGISTTVETVIIPAVASEFHDVTSIVIGNSAGASFIQIRDTIGGTVLYTIYSPATSFITVPLSHPISQAVSNSAWTAQAVTAGANAFITMQFVKNV